MYHQQPVLEESMCLERRARQESNICLKQNLILDCIADRFLIQQEVSQQESQLAYPE